MRKFIANAQIIAMMAILPAIMIAYLHTDNKENKKEQKTQIVRKGFSLSEAGSVFHLVKSF